MKTEETKTLSLTDEEAYILGCVMAYVRYQRGNVSTLLTKIDELQDKELDCEDYDKVSFRVDIEGSKVPEVTIDFNY